MKCQEEIQGKENAHLIGGEEVGRKRRGEEKQRWRGERDKGRGIE